MFMIRPATVVLLCCCRFHGFLVLLFSAVVTSTFALKSLSFSFLAVVIPLA